MFSSLANKVADKVADKLKETGLQDKVDALGEQVTHNRSKVGKLGNLWNTNHRHDEEHEKATDDKRAKICESHRFSSFFPEQQGNNVKWYVDGRDYFWAVSVALENAKETIYITDWWISPEFYLRRPPSTNKEWRLDEILKRKAEQGVMIYVSVYREVEAALPCNSQHTKTALKALCPPGSPGHGNIKIMRHPDHNVFENAGDMTLFWAHHEKFIVVDYEMAFIGGMDLCFGRWDTHQHPLADAHPEDRSNEVWPGQDFNNNRIMDFKNVADWEQNELSKDAYGRMPWHDVSMGLVGPCVYDIAEHFVLRWNFIKRDKYKRDPRFSWLTLEGREAENEDIIGVQRPKYPVGGYVNHPVTPLATKKLDGRGTVRAQVIRSSADWSSGILPENSIHSAYEEIIRGAKHYVYIENQFFITATGDQQSPVHNTIGKAIVDAVLSAAQEKRKFRIVVLLPAVPGFAGDLRDDAATGTRAIMDYQYKSICRGEHSIFGKIKAAGVDPTQYIFFFNLRSYDRINNSPVSPEQPQGDEARDAEPPTPTIKRSGSSMDAAYSVAHHAMAQTASVSQRTWEGSDREEVNNWIQEELYIHSKLLIADDRIVVCGSSNLNDRSQIGYHDSELSIVMEDTRKIKTKMGGEDFEAGHHAATLRRYLWREHLGLLPPQELDATNDPNAQPPSDDSPNDAYDRDGSWKFVEDPLADELWDMWTGTATKNTEIFRHLFHADPDDHIINFEEYNNFLPPKGVKAGHIYDRMIPTADVRAKLDQVKGHLVWMPLEFLKDAPMAEKGLQINPLTESIFT